MTHVQHQCPVRGHSHALVHVQEHTQDGTGLKADTWECPTGQYRWFLIRGRQIADGARRMRPRWGWSKNG